MKLIASGLAVVVIVINFYFVGVFVDQMNKVHWIVYLLLALILFIYIAFVTYLVRQI